MARRIEMTGTTLPSAAAQPQSAPPMSPGAAVVAEVGVAGEPPDEQARGKGRRDNRPLLSTLISTILHTLLLVLLALFSFRPSEPNDLVLLVKIVHPEADLSLESFDPQQERQVSEDALADQPVEVSVSHSTTQTVPVPMLQTAEQPLDPELIEFAASGGGAPSQSLLLRIPKGGLSGRTPEGRAELGAKYGATRQSEEAVEAALRWLAEHQRPNGSWSFDLSLDPCNGRCRHSEQSGDTETPATAATGLALLAFLGAGYTHHVDSPYAETVRRGIYYLRDAAAEAEAGCDWQQGSMYGHGIALMAMAEALAMTSEDDDIDRDLQRLVSRGASFTAVAQHDSGSWGYVPGSPGDTTVTGWQVLSLIAAKRSRVELRTNTLLNARQFIMSTCTERDYWFGYKGPPGEPTTTAIGLTLMLYLGESPDYTPFYDAIGGLAERGPTLNNVYHDYYGTLALHHCRHHEWDSWNTRLRDHLVRTQAKSGHEAGSWHFRDRWGDVGGRLYTTAMCAMILEVYYRYLPMYGPIEKFPL